MYTVHCMCIMYCGKWSQTVGFFLNDGASKCVLNQYIWRCETVWAANCCLHVIALFMLTALKIIILPMNLNQYDRQVSIKTRKSFCLPNLFVIHTQHLPDSRPRSARGADTRPAAVGQPRDWRTSCYSAGLQPPWPWHHGQTPALPQGAPHLRLALLQIFDHWRYKIVHALSGAWNKRWVIELSLF